MSKEAPGHTDLMVCPENLDEWLEKNPLPVAPERGLKFYHSRVTDENDRPLLYVVTKVARGTAYYRPVDGGSPDCCPVAQFERWVKEIA